MRIATLPLGSSFRWKLIPAALVAVLGDIIFYQQQHAGGHLGLLALGLLAALLAGHPTVRRSPRAWIPILIATVFAIALLYDPSTLAWTLFWVAAGMATLLPATARFDDGWRWTQRLLWQLAAGVSRTFAGRAYGSVRRIAGTTARRRRAFGQVAPGAGEQDAANCQASSAPRWAP